MCAKSRLGSFAAGYKSTFNHNNWVSRDDWSVTIKQSTAVLVSRCSTRANALDEGNMAVGNDV
jgi:hypothetical protein